MTDVADVAAWMLRTYPTRNWLEQCERSDWNAVFFAAGQPGSMESQGYATAAKSRAASHIDGMDLAGAQPGDSLWWAFPPEDHTMIYLGNDLAFGATSRGERVADFGHGLVVIKASSYPTKFQGRARKHGAWPEVSITTSLGQPVTAPAAAPAGGLGMLVPPAAIAAAIQAGLKRRGRYSGPADGVFGVNSWKGIQESISTKHGANYAGPIDGIPGFNTAVNVQLYAKKWGGYRGPIDGVLGINSWQGFLNGIR